MVGILPIVAFKSPIFGRFGVSLPFVNYGGVVAESDDVAAAARREARRWPRARRLSHLELRHLEPRYSGICRRSSTRWR